MRANDFSIAEVRKHWDAVSDDYNRINEGFGWTHSQRFEVMSSYLPQKTSPKILNVWSRTGNAIPYLRKKYPDADITNLEASEKLMEIARKKYPNEKFQQTDLHDFPFETESMDVIVSLETLEHVPDPLHFLLECHRVLKVGGRLIMSLPPAHAELPLRLYEKFFENHGEGPHRFLSVSEVKKVMKNCEFTLIEHRGTVVFPVGPVWLKKAAEALQKNLLRFIGFNRAGIRQFYVAEKRASRDPVWAKIYEEIIRPGLSMHSGTAEGLSNGTLALDDPDGACLPRLTGRGSVPQICYDASPEVNPSYPKMNEMVFGKKDPRSMLLGEYKRIAIAHSTDEEIRSNAASGGILTAVLCHLLETGKIKGAVVLTMDKEKPWRAIPTIAHTKAEILDSGQSKYAVSPVNTILSELEKEEGPLAYVGLPHQVFAIRRLLSLKHPSVRSIKYVFGPFFGNELYGSSVKSFLRKFGVKKEDLQSLSYRAGEWPGYMEAKMKNARLPPASAGTDGDGQGKTVRMPKFHANYLIPFHITQSSLLSHDLTNEFTDLSGGDAWAPVYEERGKGFSLLITRSETGDALIKEMEQAGKLWLKDIDEEEAVKMQSHGLDFKKRGSLLRIHYRQKRGLRTYDFGLALGKISMSRRIFERLLDAVFVICAWPLSRWVADMIPDGIIGPLFQWFRRVWKASTKKVKRSGLKN